MVSVLPPIMVGNYTASRELGHRWSLYMRQKLPLRQNAIKACHLTTNSGIECHSLHYWTVAWSQTVKSPHAVFVLHRIMSHAFHSRTDASWLNIHGLTLWQYTFDTGLEVFANMKQIRIDADCPECEDAGLSTSCYWGHTKPTNWNKKGRIMSGHCYVLLCSKMAPAMRLICHRPKAHHTQCLDWERTLWLLFW